MFRAASNASYADATLAAYVSAARRKSPAIEDRRLLDTLRTTKEKLAARSADRLTAARCSWIAADDVPRALVLLRPQAEAAVFRETTRDVLGVVRDATGPEVYLADLGALAASYCRTIKVAG